MKKAMKLEKNSEGDLRVKTIEAVKEGRAVPTPKFAIEEGGEMLETLKSEIGKLDGEQLRQFKRALLEAGSATTIEGLVKALDRTSLLEKTGLLIPATLAFFFGTLISGNPFLGGVPGAAV